MYPRFILRVAKELKLSDGQSSKSNQPVGDFIKKGNCYSFKFKHPISMTTNDDDDILYQIYPGNPNKCFFDLAEKECMIISCILSNNKESVCAVHSINDQYPYFKILPETIKITIVIENKKNKVR